MKTDPNILNLFDWPLCRINSTEGNGKTPHGSAWQTRPCTLEDIDAWNQGFGVLLGGDSCIIDFDEDGPHAAEDFERLFHGISVPTTASWSSAKGNHRLFRLTPEQGQQLGHFKSPAVGQLEIRWGRDDCHILQTVLPFEGNNKEWTNGPAKLANLTDEMLGRLIALNSGVREIEAYDKDLDMTKPGNIYDSEIDFPAVLIEDGMIPTGSRTDGVLDFKHPDTDQKMSMTFGWHPGRLHIFTTSLPPLEQSKSYLPHQYLAHRHFNSNFKEMAKYLITEGYFHKVTAADFGEITEEPEPPKRDGIPTELLDFGGFIHDFAAWHVARMEDGDFRAGIFAGFCALSWLTGRKVRMEDDTRGNLCTMLLGPSASGKTEAIRSIEKFLQYLGRGNEIKGEFKSGEGMADVLQKTANCIQVIEELQDVLPAMNGAKGTSAFQQSKATFIKKIATASRDQFSYRVGAASATSVEHAPIDQPHVVHIMTGIEKDTWEAIGSKMVTDGTLGRTFAFDIAKLVLPDEPVVAQKELAAECFERLVLHAKWWLAQENVPQANMTDKDASGLVTEQRQLPRVPATPEARKLMRAFKVRASKVNADGGGSAEASAAMWHRAHEMMMKFCLLITASDYDIETKMLVDKEIVLQAVELTERSIRYKMESLETFKEATPFTDLCDEIRSFVYQQEQAGTLVVKNRDLARKLRRPISWYAEAVGYLLETGQVYTDAVFNMDQNKIISRSPQYCLPKHRHLVEVKAKGK